MGAAQRPLAAFFELASDAIAAADFNPVVQLGFFFVKYDWIPPVIVWVLGSPACDWVITRHTDLQPDAATHRAVARVIPTISFPRGAREEFF